MSTKVRRYTAAACLAVKSRAFVPAIVSSAIGKPVCFQSKSVKEPKMTPNEE